MTEEGDIMSDNYGQLCVNLLKLREWSGKLDQLQHRKAQIDADISIARREVYEGKKRIDEMIANWEDDW